MDLMTHLTDLGALMQQEQALSAPYQAQIKALELERDTATAALRFQIDTLKAVLREHILAHGQTVRADGVTAIYTHKQGWDTEGLLAMAKEIPAIMQCAKDASYVTFRFRTKV